MPKLNRPPKLCQERNLAIVYSDGKRKSLGRWGSDEAKKNYSRFVSEWKLNRQAALAGAAGHTVVADLFLAYAEQAASELDPRDCGHSRTITEEIVNLYADTPADEFGPKSLAAVQKKLEQSGRFSRGYVNKLINRARTIFRWGVSQELVSPLTADALKYVQPLRKGKTIARECDPREAVPDEIVAKTLPYLWPTVAGMVRVQRLAAMRPNEVCRMTVGDLDTSGEIWLYRPGMHKGTWRGHEKAVALGKIEQGIIQPRLVGKSPENAIFSPRETDAEKKSAAAANRRTPVQPSQQKRAENRAKHPKSRVRDHYDAQSYARSIKYAIEKANRNGVVIPHWTPYQLRHAAATEITEAAGLDVARAVLGQRTINVTQRYNHADQRIAEKHAAGRGKKS